MSRSNILIAQRLMIRLVILIGMLTVFAGSVLVVAWQAPLVRDQIVADE